MLGIGAVLFAFCIAVYAFRDSKNPAEVIPAVLGSTVAAVGTLAGLVAGHAAGAAGTERAEQRADANEKDAAAGRGLAATLKADAATGTVDPAQETFGVEDRPDDAVLRRHAQLAAELFP